MLISDVSNGPEELYDQMPFIVEFVRLLAGPDRQDYWLGSVVLPLEWWVDGEERSVRYVVLATRNAEQSLDTDTRDTPVDIAFVTDQTLLGDARFDEAKCRFVASGVCRDLAFQT